MLLAAGCTTKYVTIPAASPSPSAQSATPTPTPDEPKCRAAIASDYANGWEGDDTWPPATRKPVCAGFNRPTLDRLIDEAIDDLMNGTTGP
jgi:hypothetical protein